MKRVIRIVALILVAGSVVFWSTKGANRGWTKTSVPTKSVDEFGMEEIKFEKRFVPGVDFLAGAAGVSALLLGISFFFRNKNQHTTS